MTKKITLIEATSREEIETDETFLAELLGLDKNVEPDAYKSIMSGFFGFGAEDE